MASGNRTAADLGAWLIFEDEAGQGLRPPKGRTWGRRGQTPVVKVTGAHAWRSRSGGRGGAGQATSWPPASRQRADRPAAHQFAGGEPGGARRGNCLRGCGHRVAGRRHAGRWTSGGWPPGMPSGGSPGPTGPAHTDGLRRWWRCFAWGRPFCLSSAAMASQPGPPIPPNSTALSDDHSQPERSPSRLTERSRRSWRSERLRFGSG